MFKIIEKYMDGLTINNFQLLAVKNEIFLTEEELEFSYNFVKKNWNTILSNPNSFDLSKYRDKFSEENFIKIKKLYLNSLNKYSRYL